MEVCIFCQVVRGERSAYILFEGDRVLAFLDAYPCTPGHTLVIPKAHYRSLTEFPKEEASGYFQAIVEIAKVIQRAMKADGFNLGINDGRAAGQVVPHAHVHILPRYRGDGGSGVQRIVWAGAKGPSLAEVAERIRAEMTSTS